MPDYTRRDGDFHPSRSAVETRLRKFSQTFREENKMLLFSRRRKIHVLHQEDNKNLKSFSLFRLVLRLNNVSNENDPRMHEKTYPS